MLLLCITLVAGACLAAAVLGRYLGRNLGLLLAAPLLAAAALQVVAASTNAAEESWSWIPTLGVSIALRLDGLGLVFGLLVTVIGASVLIYSARYLAPGRQTSFYVLMTLFALAMLVLVLADDVVLLFVAWEVTTLCSFFLIARSGPSAREPAIRTLLVTALGGLALLAAVVATALAAGTTRLSVILDAPFWATDAAATTWIAVLLAVAAFTKSAQFPFQAWLPDSMAAITPVSAYLHAAAMVKAGIYLMLRFSPVLNDHAVWSTLLIAAGATTALLGAAAAIRRTDLKELLAYSTISQLGLITVLIGVGTPGALTAAVVHTIAHALFKATLFMVVGIVDVRAGTRDIRELAGLRMRLPFTLSAAVLAASSMAGVPPLLGFVSKEGMFASLIDAPGPSVIASLVAAAVALTAVLTFAYSGRFIIGALGGRSGRVVTEGSVTFWVVPVILALSGLVLGVLPFLLDGLVGTASTSAVGTTIDAHLVLWHGVTPALIMSIVVISLGTALVVLRDRVGTVVAHFRFPFSALDVVDAIRIGVIRFGALTGRMTATDAPRRHLLIPLLCLLGIAGVSAVQLTDLPPVVGDPTRPLDWVLVALILSGTVAAVLAHTRVAAIVVMGMIGFAMTLWFFWLGAADVALTQLLVEILTVCVLVLVLRHLPRRFHRDRMPRRMFSAIVAVLAGVATTAAVLALTGRRELSAAADYFLGNAEEETGGANIVNTILVDFRALDTLGELTVLGIAGVAMAVLLSARRMSTLAEDDSPFVTASPLADARSNAVFTRTLTRWIVPVIIVLSLMLLLRGHQEPGGGFIAALVGAAGFALLYLAAPSDRESRIRWPYLALIGLGVAIATLTGLAGYAEVSFLRPLHADVLGVKLTTALVFDVGVYLTVVGVVLAALNLLGIERRSPALTATTERSAR